MRVQTQFLLINIIGGVAVLGGYIIALLNHPETRNELWGGVPENLRLSIIAFMFVSAFGYCFAMYYFARCFSALDSRHGLLDCCPGGSQFVS